MSYLAQRSMASGELSPSLYGRTDFNRYFTGLAKCRNFYIKKTGGAENRSGTEFIAEVKDSTKTVRFIPFVFNNSQTYVLEFGNLYMRVHKDGVQLKTTAQAITGVTNANPAVITYTGADTIATGDEVALSTFAGSLGTYLNNRNFKIGTVNTGANTAQLLNMDGSNFNSTSLPAYTSGGQFEEVYEIITTYAEADLPNLKFAQSADVITIAHPSYPVREVSRTADTSWSIADASFTPTQVAQASLAITRVGAAGTVAYYYLVTAVSATTFEESLSTGLGTLQITNGVSPLTVANYIQTSWGAASGAGYYNIYRSDNSSGPYGFIGTTNALSFNDIGYTPDISDPAPAFTPRGLFSNPNYPSCVLYSQQRRFFANSNTSTETVWGSKTGLYKNFEREFPIQDNNAIDFSLSGNQVNSVRHMIDLGNIILLTETGEKVAQGNANGVLTPTEINLKQYSYNGSANNPPPIIIDNSALYLQNGSSIIRDLGFDFQVDGYRGNDLTNFSSHLFEGYEIVDWTFQKIPNSIVWAVRSDGTLLSLTYIKEQQMLAWTRHDFEGGEVENVCSVPNGSKNDVYFCIKRTINGRTVRYVERFTDRFFSDLKDYNFTDASLSYDGRHTGSTTMTLSGSGWTYTDTLTLTASASYFTSAKVGNQIHLVGADGSLIRFTIDAYTSPTVATGRPTTTVPSSMRSVAISTWAEAVDEVTGLWHLEGEEVSVIGDGYVVGSALNENYTTYIVTNGSLTFNNQWYTTYHIGLPFVSDIETLNIDVVQGETLAAASLLTTEVTVQVEKTRGGYIGTKCPEDDILNSDEDPLYNLTEMKQRDFENYTEGIDLSKGKFKHSTVATWEENARVFIRQIDPQPMSILSIIPRGLYAGGR